MAAMDMERDLKYETNAINRRTLYYLIGNIVFSVAYFGAFFLFCKEKETGQFLWVMFLYACGELLFGACYLWSTKHPLDHMIETVKRATQDEYQAQNLRTQAEVYALQSQINPHFLYNTLDTIRSYALLSDAEDIAVMTESLSTLFRYSISRPGEMTTLREELENVKNYLRIQQYRFPDKVEYEEEIEDSDILNCRMPVLTIQPIVENAIHHGLEMKIGKGCIKVKAFRVDREIKLFVRDDGIGMSETVLGRLRQKLEREEEEEEVQGIRRKGKGSGIALKNVDKRLKFYYGSQYGLKIRSTLDVGTLVEINLPYLKNESGSSGEDVSL